MKKWLLLSLLSVCFNTPIHAQNLPLTQFGGLDTDNDPLFVQDGMTPDAENVNTDDALGISPRKGFTRFSTQTPQNQWVFSHSNGTRYIIIKSSNLLKADTGLGTFVLTVSTVAFNINTVASALGDLWYFSDTENGLKYWNTSSATVVSPSLKFTGMATHKGRLWGIGVPGNERTIYGSKLYDGTNWSLAVDPTEDDPVRLTVQGSLDENITGLYASFRDILVWLKPTSFGGIYGSRRSAFLSRSYSETIGSAYPESVQDCEGVLRFIGPRKTIYEFDGSNLKKISENIDTLMETVVQGDLSLRSWIQTTSEDWSRGIFGLYMSSNTTSGDIVFVSTVAFLENFKDVELSSNPAWLPLNPEFTITDFILRKNNTGNHAFIFTPSTNTIGTWTFNGPIDFTDSTGHYNQWFVFMGLEISSIPANPSGYYLRMEKTGETTIVTYSLRKQNYSETILVSSDVHKDVVVNKLQITRTSSSTFVVSRNNGISMLTATDSEFSSSTYIKIRMDGTTQGSNFGLSHITFQQADSRISTYTSQSFNVGNNNTSWGVFDTDESLRDGNITYRIFSDTNSDLKILDSTTFISSQAIFSGQIPSITTGNYVTISAVFSTDIPTNNVTLSRFTVRWNQGSTLRVASAYFNQRYWLGVAISSTSNNKVLVYNRRRQWDRYSGINMVASGIYNGNIVFCNIAGVWQAETGASDDGASILAYYRHKTVVPSGFQFMSTYRDLFMLTSNSVATLQTEYYVDGINTAYNLPSYQMNAQSGYQNFVLPFSATSVQQSRTIDFKWTVSSASSWRILGGILDFIPEPVPTIQ